MTDIAIIETGAPPVHLRAPFGTYPDMVRRLLGDDLGYRTFDARAGDLPGVGDRFGGWLLTGSPSSVLDDESWIRDLEQLVRDKAGQIPMVGICFGHQLIAKALGGEVARSQLGWGIGLHSYALTTPHDGVSVIRVPASHQEQVIRPPAGAVVSAASAFTPFAALRYPAQRLLSVQFHPEFRPDFAIALVEARRGTVFDTAAADAAVRSLRRPSDSTIVRAWIRGLFQGGGKG